MIRPARKQNRELFTPREMELLNLIVEGRLHKEIKFLMGISMNTIKNHFAHMYEKTGTHGHVPLVVYAFRNRIIPVDNHFMGAVVELEPDYGRPN